MSLPEPPLPFKVGDYLLISEWAFAETNGVDSVAIKINRIVLPDLLLVEYVRVRKEVVSLGLGRLQVSDIKKWNFITSEQFACFQNLKE